VQPVISYFHGRGEEARARGLMVFLFKTIAVLGVGMSAGVALFARGFIAVFTPGDAELIGFTHDKATLYFIGFVFAGLSIVIITYFQSIQKAAPALLLALLRSVVFVMLFLYCFPMIWGPESIWPALSIAEFAACSVGVWLYFRTPTVRSRLA
jgi:Na+-driven multidrug efflux pump